MTSTVRPRIDLLQLHFFVAVVDAGSITKASRQCHIAQPALSKRVASLEEELGVQLLHRAAHGVEATDEGMVLYAASRRILRDIAGIADEVHSTGSNPMGEVRLACQDSLTRMISRALAKEVLTNLPQIRLAATAGQSMEIYQALGQGIVDLAVIVHDEELRNLTIDLLIEEEIFVVGSPDLFGDTRDEIDLAALARLPFVFPSSTTFATGQMVVNILGTDDAPINIVAMVDGDALKALIVDGLGCCVLPWSYMQPEIESGEIVYKRVAGKRLKRTIALCSSNERPRSSATRAVATLARRLIEEALASGTWKHARILEREPANEQP